MKKFLNIAAALCAVALLSTTSMAQMGRRSGPSGGSRPSYSAPRQTHNPPRQTHTTPRQTSSPSQSGGMGRSGSMNQTPSVSTTQSGSGMGRSGGFNQTPSLSQPRSSQSPSKRSTTPNPRVGGATSSTTHVYSIGSRPNVRYSRTAIVGGRTQYIYPDGSYSWSATGVIVGYLAQQNAYNQGVADAQMRQNRYNDGYTQPIVVQQGGVGAGTVIMIVLVIFGIVGFAYFMTRSN